MTMPASDPRSSAEAILRTMACGGARCACSRAERRGHGLTHCPVHQDNSPSLNVGISASGKLVVYCHGSCGQQTVIEALTAQGMWPEHAEYGDRVEFAKYDYNDAGGHLLFQVVRYFPKDFRQRRRAAGGAWEWNLNGVTRVLYRLPELIASGQRQVFIVEGEKDVERLRAEGFIATCNVGGAGKWRPEYNDFFRERQVVIVVDNDDAGRSHSLAVARSLNGIAQRMRFLELPGLDEHGDISDWFDDGGSALQLRELALAAPDPPIDHSRRMVFRREGTGFHFEPVEAQISVDFTRLADHKDETTAEISIKKLDGTPIGRRRLNLLGATGVPRNLVDMLDVAQLGVDKELWPAILGRGFEQVIDAHRDGVVLDIIEGEVRRPDPPAWMCSGLVMRNKVNCWLGAAGTGKSTLAKMLCVCVAAGRTFLGRGVEQGIPLYLDWEDDREDFERVIHDTCQWLEVWPVPRIGWINMRGKRFRDAVESLSRHITDLGVRLLVIDSIAAAGGAGGDHRSYEDIALELEQCVGQLPQVTILGLDHITSDEHKNGAIAVPQKARGSERKVEIYRNQWTLMVDHQQREQQKHVISFYHTKINADVFYPRFTVEIEHQPGRLSVGEVSATSSPETIERLTWQQQYEIHVQQNPGSTTDDVMLEVRGVRRDQRMRDNVARELGRSMRRGVLERDESGRWWPAGHSEMPQTEEMLEPEPEDADESENESSDLPW